MGFVFIKSEDLDIQEADKEIGWLLVFYRIRFSSNPLRDFTFRGRQHVDLKMFTFPFL